MTKKLEYDDEFLFQKLPTPEEWERIKKDLSAYKTMHEESPKKCKWVLIDKTHWFNFITKKKGTVHNIVIAAFNDDSGRSHAINRIEEQVYREDGCMWNTINEWVFNEEYGHVNLNRDGYNKSLYVEENEDKTLWTRRYVLWYQDVCCPITQHHFFIKDEEELTKIFKGQLMGQNNNSPFQHVRSVKNNYRDDVVTTNSSEELKANAPIVQLITRKGISYLRDPNNMRAELERLTLPTSDKQMMVKFLKDNYYTTVDKDDMTDERMFNEVSHYYPVIDYEQVKHITESIPKVEVDFSCIGIGSAGTGILDQVGRGNWFKSYLLVDPDRIERKNVRNQWYLIGQSGMYKSDASENTLRNIYNIDEAPTIYKYARKFQEAGLENYISKYIVSGFDSIECRLELLDMIIAGKHQAKYLIDTRYDDLAASIFFIDMAEEKQVDYYRKGLVSDLEAFKELQRKEEDSRLITTWEDYLAYLKAKGCFNYSCGECQKELTGAAHIYSCDINLDEEACGSAKCLAAWKKRWDERPEDVRILAPKQAEESSCVKQNFIDVYKYASSFVFAAIREIESGNPKPFTHVEVSTDVLPKSMVLRK